MTKLTAAARDKIPAKKFALPGGRFPLEDATHQRNAISGATRSYHAGNISEAEKDKIQARARHLLGIKTPASANDDYHNGPMAAPGVGGGPGASRGGGMFGMASFAPRHADARKHALSLASAKHLHAEGHINSAHRDAIQKVARAGMGLAKPGPDQDTSPLAAAGMPNSGAPPFGALGGGLLGGNG